MPTPATADVPFGQILPHGHNFDLGATGRVCLMRLAHLFDLSGRRALVTGGNSGIGLAMARALGLAGPSVALAARAREKAGGERLDELVADGIDAHATHPNRSGRSSALALAKAAEEPWTSTVNAAGGQHCGTPDWPSHARAFDLHMALHLRAPFLLVQHLAGIWSRGLGACEQRLASIGARPLPIPRPTGGQTAASVQLTPCHA